MQFKLSHAATAEKAQQLPHAPWSLTEVTRQSRTVWSIGVGFQVGVGAGLPFPPTVGALIVRYKETNSAFVREVNLLTPSLCVEAGLLLFASILAMLAL